MRKQSLKLVDKAWNLAYAKVDAKKAKVKGFKRIPNLRNMTELKSFTIRWFDGIIKALDSVYKSETEEKLNEAKLVSRTDLSSANDPQSRANLLADKQVCFNNKGFYGTPLPLIPDIRKRLETSWPVFNGENPFMSEMKRNGNLKTCTIRFSPTLLLSSCNSVP
jgi:hypothetical protein